MSLLSHKDMQEASQIQESASPELFRSVIEEISEATGISTHLILGRSRSQPIVRARQLTCHVLWRHGMTMSMIGRLMKLDPTTVSHAVRAVEARRGR